MAASLRDMASTSETQSEIDVSYTLETSGHQKLTFVEIGGETDGVGAARGGMALAYVAPAGVWINNTFELMPGGRELEEPA